MNLIFVYNANGGKFNAFMDMMHKVVSPTTYPCSLCAITYGTFTIEPEWEAFIATLSTPPVFLHKDEFLLQYPNNNTALPAVFEIGNGNLQLLITAEEMQKMQLPELIQRIKALQT